MNVMLCRVTIGDAQLLVNLDTQHMRAIVTTILIE